MENFKQRKSIRLEAENGIAITPHGVAQVINLTKDGVSVKYLQEIDLPNEWFMDIYDATGLNLEGVRVKKVWEKCLSILNALSPFSVEVGAEFQDLTPLQEHLLGSYLQQLEGQENNI